MGVVLDMPRRGAGTLEPFRSAEGAWFWTMQMLAARKDGAGAGFGQGGIRPCEPDDVVKVLDVLYRQRRITLANAHVLRIWGERGKAPDPSFPAQRGDHRLWREAMDAMEPVLRQKGIVGR
jgi:hypothetical protein